jgi:hypothetical protein
MPLDSGAIASQVGASRGLWTHTPVDWRGNEPPGTAQPGGWPPNASDATAVFPNGSPTYAQAATITAISVTGITATAATVNFTLSQSATNQVEYGTTTAYGLSNTEGSGTGAQTKALAGLTTVTLYHYRIRATVNNLNTYSADRTFTTV